MTAQDASSICHRPKAHVRPSYKTSNLTCFPKSVPLDLIYMSLLHVPSPLIVLSLLCKRGDCLERCDGYQVLLLYDRSTNKTHELVSSVQLSFEYRLPPLNKGKKTGQDCVRTVVKAITGIQYGE